MTGCGLVLLQGVPASSIRFSSAKHFAPLLVGHPRNDQFGLIPEETVVWIVGFSCSCSGTYLRVCAYSMLFKLNVVFFNCVFVS